MKQKYHIITFGCQMNKSDSERIAAVLESPGLKPAKTIEGADLIVVNMCSVRQSAVDRVFGLSQKLVKLKTQNSKLKTILTGCILKKDKEKFQEIFDYVLETKDLNKWPKILGVKKVTEYNHDRRNIPLVEIKSDYFKIKPKCENKFSAFVPIMTGCNNFCAFCVVPYTRGREISRPSKEIICEIKNLIKRGYKEIWLLGQNVNSYKDNSDNPNTNPTLKNCRCPSDRLDNGNEQKREISFPGLLKMVNDIPGNFWIRFTSPHPKNFSDELIGIIAKGGKITPYLNLPIQAGDDKILKKMNRPYTIAQYKNLVKKIRSKIPNITLSTDIIVGFPGETKKQFENSVKFFKQIKYDMAYIAEYSPRPGTAAAKIENNVPKKEKARRRKILTEILKKNALNKNKGYIGKIVEVLVAERAGNYYIGKTKEYKTIKFQVSGFKTQNLVGKLIKVKITDALPWGLRGRL